LDCPEEFTEFAGAYAARLRRTAYLLCGNWHTAEDLTQIALTQTLLSWRKVHRLDNAPAYAHRTLVNAYLAQRRSRKSGELPMALPPDAAVPAGTTELRLVLLQALDTLTPSARAIVVLRVLGRPEHRPGSRDAAMHDRQREKPELTGPGATSRLAGQRAGIPAGDRLSD
jgi:DNA-directed RNA polymerase specialized sigma24 family protein